MKKTFLILVLAFLMFSSFAFVLAEGNESNNNSGDLDEGECVFDSDCEQGINCIEGECMYLDEFMLEDDENEEIEIEEEFEYEENDEIVKGKYKYKYKNEGKYEEEVEFQYRHDNRWKFRVGEYGVLCEEGCNLNETNETNGTHFNAWFSNGKHAVIKIMPDVAAERALERLRLINCIEEEGCTIELKDVGEREDSEDNETKAVYELKRDRDSKIFGFIKSKMHVKAQVDAETGEIVKVDKSWWAFLASEPQETEELLE